MTDGEPQGSLGKLKKDSSESIGELREFLSRMHGKSPQEVLGAVANSGLVMSTLLSAVVFAFLLFGMSFATWAIGDKSAKTPATAAAANASNPTTQPEAADQPAATAATEPTTPAVADGDSQPSGDATLDALGIGETKTAAPDENPRSGELEGLLDGLK